MRNTVRTGDRAGLTAAIDLHRQALDICPSDHPAQAAILANLAAALYVRFDWSGSRADLDEAVVAGRAALAAHRPGDPNLAGWLSNLSAALRTRSERWGSRADLNEAISVGRHAVAASPPDHPETIKRLGNLAAALRIRSEWTGSEADLDEAVSAGREALAVSSHHPERTTMLANHVAALRLRSERTGSQADLDEAIRAGRAALAAWASGDPAKVALVTNLGTALQARFELLGNRADLDEAIGAARDAVTASPPDHLDRATAVANLGLALRIRSQRTGSEADLDEAVSTGRAALAASPPDHPHRAGWLSNLAAALLIRSEWTGSQADLDDAVSAGRDAVASSPPDHPDRGTRLANLSRALLTRFELLDSQADLDEAVTAGRDAVASSPPDHPGMASYLSNLSRALLTRFELLDSQADLDEAVTAGRDAVATSPPTHPYRAAWLSNLGIALLTRFERSPSQADLDEAVMACRGALDASPPDHPYRAAWLSNLGTALSLRFEQYGDQADLDEAIAASRAAVAVEVASPRLRARAARGWGHTAADGMRWDEAVAGFAAAVDLLGRVAPRSLARGDQEHLLAELGGLGSQAAACCVHAGLPERAIELFEQGRGVLLGQALDTRTDLTALAEQFPDLARRFIALRDDLDRVDGSGTRPVTIPPGWDHSVDITHGDVERRRQLADAFDQTIGEIRDLPAFARFLRPPPVQDLTAAAASGPVVVVNVSRFGSHALILTTGGVLEPVPLVALTTEAVYDQADGFLAALDEVSSPDGGAGGWGAAQRRLTDTLGWLWDAATGPVLDRLGITGPPQKDEEWPRLWWCVSGLLSFLPLHAAGHHATRFDPAPKTVVDRVVSSYTPTIRALIYARRTHSGDRDVDRGRLGSDSRLVVAMPHTPEAADLPGADAEVAMLQQRFPDRTSTLVGPQATREAVLAALPTAGWAHLACHGSSDPSHPSASRLLLQDHRQQPLTVVDVARLRLDDAQLAFLSACSTARPGNRLADEAIHLASAFQLAGYRHVIGTLSPINDRHAATLARDIYTALDDADGVIDAAAALHAATRRLRNRWAHMPSVWASHIHSGA
ncbi:CHAT domain-containing protein [Parafrankia sp. EAN1pec]|uniref:CHAT domain-containing tetratricopeptide repeat protein n=1 Tax=Parafrankia sp. (strain EAN1pec) TaxID=298653 RepID=UPI0002ED1EE9